MTGRVLTVLLTALALALAAAAPATAAEPRASLPDIEDEVMCVECGTALNISQAPSADRQREFIRRRIAEGLTKDEIKDALVAEYGRNVLAVPPNRGFSIGAWLVPVVLALLAFAAVATTARRWKRASAMRPEPAAAREPDIDPEDRRRVDRDMASYDL